MAEDLIDRAVEMIHSNRFREALTILRQALEQNPSNWNTWYLAGQCCRILNDIDQAIEYLSRATTMKTDNPSAFLALGIAFQLRSQWNEAIEALRRAIEIDPDFELAYNSLALTQKKSGELEKALNNYEAGAQALARRIVKHMRNDRSAPIIKHCDTVGTLWLEYAYYAALYLTAFAGIHTMAWPTAERAMEEEETEEHGGLYWVDTLSAEQKTNRLYLPNYFNTFRETLRQDPAYSNLIGNRGTVLQLLGRHEEARLHFEEGKEFRPIT